MFDENPLQSNVFPGQASNPYGQPGMVGPGGEAVTPSSDGIRSAVPAGKAEKHIHSMPGKFLSSPGGKQKNNRTLIFIVIALALVLLGGGLLAFFKYANPENTNTVTNTVVTNRQTNSNANANTNGNQNVNANTNGNGNINSNANANTNTNLPTIVKGSLTDPETNEKISSATLTIPSGALPSSVTTVSITTLPAELGAYATSEKYQAVGAVFVVTPSQTKLSKDASLEISYLDSELLALGFSVKVSDLTIASWSKNEWVPLNSVVDSKNHIVTTKIDQFFADGMAIVAPKPTATNTNVNTNTSTTIVPSLDSDADGLTNQEEILYGTNAGSTDTDLDSYKDGQEVLALYNPNGSGKLVTASLVKIHENTTYGYSLYYPPSWTVGTLNADKLVTFTSITGEFVQASVQENAGGLSAREWYLSLNPSVSQSQLRDIAVGSLRGVLGPDGLNVFLADANYIYQVTYNIGIKTEANYLTTFTMMYSSFLAGLAPTGTNTNTSTNANTNANTNTPTNSNTNGSSNTNGG